MYVTVTEVLNEKDKGQGCIRDSTIAQRPTYCDEGFSEALVRLFDSQDLNSVFDYLIKTRANSNRT